MINFTHFSKCAWRAWHSSSKQPEQIDSTTKSCRETNESFERKRGGEKVSGTHLIIEERKKEGRGRETRKRKNKISLRDFLIFSHGGAEKLFSLIFF
jgi:hypothetical protein